MKPPMTEQEEKDAVVYELGWLTGTAIRTVGKLPRAIADLMDNGAGGFDLGTMSTDDVASACAAIRAEFPDLDEPPTVLRQPTGLKIPKRRSSSAAVRRRSREERRR